MRLNEMMKQKKPVRPDAGFTLVELLLSISILALITIPLLNNFVIANKANQKAENLQSQTQFAQNIMEDIKAKTVLDLAKEFDYPAEFPSYNANMFEVILEDGILKKAEGEADKSILKSTYIDADGIAQSEYALVKKTADPYYFAVTNIKKGSKSYDVLITLDPSPYYSTDGLGGSYGYNAVQMPVISQIDKENNTVAVQEYEEEEALTQLYGNHIAYAASQEALHKDEPSYSIRYYTKEEIEAKLNKKMTVSLEKEGDNVTATVTFTYSCPEINGCGNADFIVKEKSMEDPYGSVYLFYNPNYKDTLIINKNTIITDDIDIYIVKQETDEDSFTETLEGDLPANINLYTNASFGITSHDLVKLNEAQNRIYNVKVQLFTAGSNFNSAERCLELNSTKEE